MIIVIFTSHLTESSKYLSFYLINLLFSYIITSGQNHVNNILYAYNFSFANPSAHFQCAKNAHAHVTEELEDFAKNCSLNKPSQCFSNCLNILHFYYDLLITFFFMTIFSAILTTTRSYAA